MIYTTSPTNSLGTAVSFARDLVPKKFRTFFYEKTFTNRTCERDVKYRHNFQTWISHENSNIIVQKKSEYSINIYETLDVRVFPKK